MDRGNFDANYAYGKIAESQIAQWLIRVYGYHLLPAYEIEIPSGKGPRLLGPYGELIAPDLLAILFNRMKVLVQWYEIKHKERFSWYRKGGGRWQTGIDLRHFEDYIKVQEQTGVEVFLLFLHRSCDPSRNDLEQGSPTNCPTGLFGGSLRDLMHNWDHKDSYDKKNRSFPMVYWNEKDLKQIATLEEFMAVLNTTERKPTTERMLGRSLDEYLNREVLPRPSDSNHTYKKTVKQTFETIKTTEMILGIPSDEFLDWVEKMRPYVEGNRND